MLKKYILDQLAANNVSEEQSDLLFQLLYNIKDNDELLQEFNGIDKRELQRETEDNPSIEDSFADTFWGAEVDFSEEIRQSDTLVEMDSEGVETFFGTEFDFTESIQQEQPEQTEEIQEKNTILHSITDAKRLNETSEMETLIPDSDTILPEKPPVPTSKIGRYQDLGLLGRGGMGEVRKIRDETLKRNLAIKIIHPTLLRSKNALNRFIEEAQVGAQLQHPNIVPVHEMGKLPDGRFYFTMKEIKGKEFTELITEVHKESTKETWKETKDGVTFRQLIQIFQKICETIAYAHTLGVIHRDLKPENVMIGGFGEVLVVDWGIAKVLGASEVDEVEEDFVQTDRSEQGLNATRMGMVAGTPTYMSPEQAMGRIDLVNTHSDIYTLGAILYEILSGKQPYTGKSAMEIVEKVKSTRPPSLLTSTEQKVISIPQAEILEDDGGKIPLLLIEICERAMEREIEDRYQSASELAKDVFDWLEGAQKRDRALKEYNVAVEVKEQAEELEATYTQCWSEANDIIQKNGFELESSWTTWEKGDIARKEAIQRRHEYRKGLQGTLVYAPELEEANEALAELLIDDIVRTVALGEPQKRERFERQFHRHLQYISKSKRHFLRERLEKERKDEIVLLRSRRGDLVGRRSLRIEISKVLQNHSRLVSLVGTAGVGKSRLALEVIYDLQEPNTKNFRSHK